MDHQSFTRLLEELDSHLAGSDLAVFPAIFDDPDLFWPDDDWRAFLAVAAKAGARMVYLERSDLGTMDRDEALALAGPHSAEVAAALEEARAWAGPTRVELGFIVGGTSHLWAAQAGWLDTLQDALADAVARPGDDTDDDDDDTDPDDDRFGRHERLSYEEREARQATEAARLVLQVEAWVAQLAEEPSVLAAANQTVRHTIAKDLIPELAEWGSPNGPLWADPEGIARRDAAWEVRRRLDDAVAVVKAQRVADARDRLDTWAAELAATTDYRAATNMDMRRRAAGAFVTVKLGFASTDLRDRLIVQLRR